MRTLLNLIVSVLALLGGLVAHPATACAQFDDPFAAMAESAVKTRVVSQKSIARPGDQFVIAVELDHADGFHSWPSLDTPLGDNLSFAIRTQFGLRGAPAWAKLDGVQYPPTHDDLVANPAGGPPITAPLFSGRAVGYLRVQISPDAPMGEHVFTVGLEYQACNASSCQMPQDEQHEVRLKIVPLESTEQGTPNEPELFASFDVGLWGQGNAGAAGGKPRPIEFNAFGIAFKLDPSGPVGLSLLLLVAALGGLLLNFTPCVLPVIPIKILSLSAAAGNPRRCLYLGIIMSLGVIFFWAVIGAAMAFISGFKSISTLFQNPWFPLAVGLFMVVMSLGMFNVFAVRLPQFVYMVNPQHETSGGSFLFGILTAVLSTPCTAPFMGAAAAWAAFQPAPVTMSTFAAIGAGMALPYLLLSANPKWISRLPRTGPGSELVKHIMGLLMLAVAAFFIGLPIAGWLQTPPDPPTRAYWWVVAALGVAAGLWLTYQTLRIAKRPLVKVAFVLIGLVFAAGNILIGASLSSHGPIKWVYYTPARFDAAVAEGKVVVMDFTAEWCLTCKALESSVLHQPEIVRLLNDTPDVVPMKVDITGNNPDGLAKLKELEWVGIPLLAFFGPGTDSPAKMDAYTPQMVKDAVEQARRRTAANAAPAIVPTSSSSNP